MMNDTIIELFVPLLGSADVSNVYYYPLACLQHMLLEFLRLSTIWKVIVLILLLSNAKNIPFVYHLRLINAFRFILHSLKPEKPISPDHLFRPLITSSHVPWAEVDLYMHKSNSTYFTDVDVARTHLICTLFARGIENVRGGTSSLVHGKPSNFGVALGAVSCSFRKELKLFEKYDLHTRVLTWDQKWIYIVTYFVKKGAILPSHFLLYPEQGGSMPRRKVSPDPDKVIAASALSKLVFKKGRVTISPEIMLEASGLLPEKVLKTSFFKDPDAVNTPQNATSETEPIIALPTQVTSTLPARRDIDEISPTSSRTNSMASLFSSNSSNGENESGTESQTSLDDSEEDVRAPPNTTAKGHQTQSQLSKWTRSRIEMERQRGMAMANHLAAQADLANGFDPTAPALGYHSDGTGLPGIISTLAQLGKLTRKSSL